MERRVSVLSQVEGSASWGRERFRPFQWTGGLKICGGFVLSEMERKGESIPAHSQKGSMNKTAVSRFPRIRNVKIILPAPWAAAAPRTRHCVGGDAPRLE